MVSTGVIIAAVVCCVLVCIGTILGIWGSGVACPDFGMDCEASPGGGTPAAGGGTPTAGRSPGTPATARSPGTPATARSPGWTSGTTGTSETSVNCKVSDWGPLGQCSKPCGGGTMVRTRTVEIPAANGGTACPTLEDKQACNVQDCPVDCEQTPWTAWGTCSAPCNGGTQTRTRTIKTQPTYNGLACGPSTDPQPCNQQECPVDCVGSWVGCNVTCGTGLDTYEITTPAKNGGKECDTVGKATKACVLAPCGVDCIGGWEGVTSSNPDGWSDSCPTCGTGKQTRKYKVTKKSAGSGKSCPYGDGYSEERDCLGLSPCPGPVDCVGDWDVWTGCSKGCGGGTRTRRYTITKDAANGGKACPKKTGDVETEECNKTSCCDPSVYKLDGWTDVTGPDGKAAPPFNCDGNAGDGRPYVLQTRPLKFPDNPNGAASATACNILVNQYRYTAIGCADRTPKGGSCSDSGVTWSAASGCGVTPSIHTTNIGGTCNPSGNPWTASGCTNSQAEVAPSYPGSCSVQGIVWSQNAGCIIDPATRTGNVSCNVGTWDQAQQKCIVSPPTTTPSGGICPAGYTYAGGNAIGSQACVKTVSCPEARVALGAGCPACNC
jgi:hypothetical protein